jgi:TetR/AcrR family transcriptional repressor of nem operon
MARPKEFSVEEALEQGMHLLWSQGYEATSLEDLISAMHLSKSSFYDTFGSKHNFLLTALTHYSDVIVGQIAGDLQKGSAFSAISRSFDLALNPPGKWPRGCFIQNCAVELAHRDPRARAGVCKGFKRLEQGYYQAVIRGQENGEFARTQDAHTLGRYLVSSLNGLQVLARAGIEDRALREVVKVTLAVLK